MKYLFAFSLILITIITVGFQQDFTVELKKAKDKILSSNLITYSYTSYWPNPVGIVDTVKGELSFLRRERELFDYDYIAAKAAYDIIYSNNDYFLVDHKKKTVFTYKKENLADKRRRVSENYIINFSPIHLLTFEKKDWAYVKDTTLKANLHHQFIITKMDTVINNNRVYVEEHIFIEVASSNLKRYERRVYNQDRLTQKIAFEYDGYNFREKGPDNLAYDMPENYITEFFENKKPLELIAEGEKAPDFSLKDLNGELVEMKNLKGKYVLINFSVINCGYCKKALDHFNNPKYTFPEDIVKLYLNPHDNKEQLSQYINKINVPFTIVHSANQVAESFGVSGFPTFVLIDPDGNVERVQGGYQSEFIESLQSL
jgi:peroxiredoxin